MMDISNILNQIMLDKHCSPMCALYLYEGGMFNDESIQQPVNHESVPKSKTLQLSATSEWNNMGARY